MKIYNIVILLLLVFVSCVQMSVKDTICEVEQMVTTENYGSAKDIVDGLLRETETKLTATEYGRISIVYMKLSEFADEDENIALATQCYRSAFDADPDSAMLFYNALPLEEVVYAEMLNALVGSIDNPQDIPSDEPMDSVNVICDSIK